MENILTELSSRKLMELVDGSRGEEREALAKLLLYLGEVDRRKLYREEGYSSLFSFCRERLGYSDAGCYRRIAAARALREMPHWYEELRVGRMTLCVVVQLGKIVGKEGAEKVLEAARGQSVREVERLVAQFQAPVTVRTKPKERVRVKRVRSVQPAAPLFEKSPQRTELELCYSLTLEADKELMELIERGKLLSGKHRVAELMHAALREYVSKHCPREREARRARRSQKVTKLKQAPRSRTIPLWTKDKVYLRDGGQCTYVSKSGHRCAETSRLEFDHIEPFALGGGHGLRNLRLRCRAHNQLEAERVFGPSISYFQR